MKITSAPCHFIQIGFVLFATIGCIGCGSKSASLPSDGGTPPPKTGASVEGLLGKDTAPAPPPPPGNAASSPAAPQASTPVGETFSPKVEEAAGQLTMFVQQFEMQYRRMPTNLNELVTPAGYLPYIFQPPKGKRWVIDPKARQVHLADQ